MIKNMLNSKVFIYPLLSLIAFLSISYIPLFSIFLVVASYLILFLYFYQPDRAKSSDIAFIVFYAGALIYSPTTTVLYLPIVLIPVYILYVIRKKLTATKPEFMYLSVILAPLTFTLMTIYTLTLMPDIRLDIYNWFLQFFTDLTAPAQKTLERFNNNGVFTYLMNNKEEATRRIISIMPALEFSFIAFLIFALDRSKPEFDIKGGLILRRFRLPDYFVWAFILLGFLSLIDNNIIKTISYNFIIIFTVLYFLQGLELLNIMFDRLRLSIFMRMLIYVFFYTEIIILLIIALIGLFNIWIKPKIFTDQRNEDSDVQH